MLLLSRISFILLLVLSMSGCGLKWTYNHLDWIVDWYKGDYLQLDESQEAEFDKALTQLQTWHRYQALPQYQAFLAKLETALVDPISPSQFRDFAKEAETFGQTLFMQIGNQFAPLLASLSPDQVTYLFDQLADNNHTFYQKRIAISETEKQANKSRKFVDFLQRWLTELTEPQQQLTDTLVKQQLPLETHFLASRVKWQKLLKQTLLSVAPRHLKIQQIKTLFQLDKRHWSDAHKKAHRDNRTLTIQWLEKIQASLTPVQTARLFEQLKTDQATLYDLYADQ